MIVLYLIVVVSVFWCLVILVPDRPEEVTSRWLLNALVIALVWPLPAVALLDLAQERARGLHHPA